MSENRQRPIVVGVDASEEALRAARFAAEEARMRHAPLRIVHAATPIVGWTERLPSDLDPSSLLRGGAEGIVAWAADAVSSAVGPEGVSTAVLDLDPLHALREESASAQLVVVGSRGVGGVTGLLLGSTAHGVAGHAQCPVIVIPDELSASVPDRRTVVVGVAGDPGDADVLAFAFAEAARRGTDLLALHAWQDDALDTAFASVGPLVDWAGVQADEERVLDEALAGWSDKEPDVAVREVVVREKPARALVAAAMTAQLLVVGHHARRTFGSATHAVLHRSNCPVAVVPLPARTPR